MSNKNGKGIIPNSMNGKTFHSLSELGEALGMKATESEQPTKKCRKCGAQMDQVPGTNVWLCHGTTEEGTPCANRVITQVRPVA